MRPLEHKDMLWCSQSGSQSTYGHHHPDYLSDAVEKIAMRGRSERKAHVSGAASGAVLPLRQNKAG